MKSSGTACRARGFLRAHGLLRKIPHTHRYHLTASGRAVITALLAVRQTAVADLLVAA